MQHATQKRGGATAMVEEANLRKGVSARSIKPAVSMSGIFALVAVALLPPVTSATRLQCADFPSWPLSAGVTLHNDSVGEPQCQRRQSLPHRWVLHQTSAPNRRPSRAEVVATLASLPSGAGYRWHSNDDICAYMRTQPLRFQALFNALLRGPHQIDLWRYLLLHQRGGIYLDDDAVLHASFNSTFIESVDSVYVTQGNGVDKDGVQSQTYGVTVYNGFLISRPCNHVLLSVAERMVQMGPTVSGGKDPTVPFYSNWYNLKLLATAIAERAPKELHPDPNCRMAVSPKACTLFQNVDRFGAIFQRRPLALYKDDHGWKTAVFVTPGCARVVSQVPGGKHGAVAPLDPHPSPWAPLRMQRMAFTHVGKTGGSYVVRRIESLAARNNFTVVKGALEHGFNPSMAVLSARLNVMKNNSVYENHAAYIHGLDGSLQWVSVVRDPFALMVSKFYYAVDVGLRGKKAEGALRRQKEDGVCGCFNLEFSACINTRYENNCSLELPRQTAYFCEPHDPDCHGEKALKNARAFTLVGLTEEMALTVKLLEKLMPWVFAGAAEAPPVRSRSTHLVNPLTNTTQSGAISTRARHQLKERATNYREEMRFYDEMKRLFWRRAAELV